MPPHIPSASTLFLGWFLLSPLVVIVVAATLSWVIAAAIVAAVYLALLALYLAAERPPSSPAGDGV